MATAQQAVNRQEAPYPAELADLVEHCTYRDGWHVRLDEDDRGQGCTGLTLTITVQVPDSYHHDRKIPVAHLFPVPPAAYNRASWCRWLFECFHQVELHEAMEFFTIDGDKVFAPNHKPGWDPYIVTQLTTELDRRTDFRGEVHTRSGV